MFFRRPALLIIVLFWPAVATGQGPTLAPQPSVLFAKSAVDAVPADSAHVDTGIKRWQGSVLGAVIGGGAGFLFMAGVTLNSVFDSCASGCVDEERSAAPLVLGTVIGGVAGYLIGGRLARD